MSLVKRKNHNAYYPCSVCDWNSPLNEVVRGNNGQEKSFCPIHRQNDEDDRQGKNKAKNRDKAHDEMHKIIFDINTTEIGDITTP